MEQGSSWEADSPSASQGNFCCLWNPKVHRRLLNSPPLDPILSHLNSVHFLAPHIIKVCFNIILQRI
jgi:hypothetical protein